MTKISTALIKSALLEEDSIQKAKVETLKLSKHRKMGEFKGKTDISSRLTKVKQVEMPKSTAPADAAKVGSGIPQSARADQYVYGTAKMGDGMKASSKADKNNSVKAQTSGTPNQSTKMKEIKGEVKDTAADKGSKRANTIPAAKMASDYTDAMSGGSKTLGAGKGGEVDAIGKQTSLKLKPSKKGGVKTAKFGQKNDKKIPQTKTPSSKNTNPSDAPKKATWDKPSSSSHNLVESGILVKLEGKTKAKFDVVNQDVLKRMYEQYRKAGYELVFERTNNVKWKKDKAFVRKLSEAIDASYNFAPQTAKKLRREALTQFNTLSQASYSKLYENRGEFSSTVMGAFRMIEGKAEQKYLASLTIYEGTIRAIIDGDLIDFEMITEARNEDMALRQLRNTIFEEYGFDAKIKHLFLDSKKFSPKQIKEWKV
ncbi:MAG: hypothetical protein DRQ39_10760 [Gammaproteobacteria bacterium]|nr:MAG: hypothetical protein DRQ39_10760 [Gammaproteobacteria bacterium]